MFTFDNQTLGYSLDLPMSTPSGAIADECVSHRRKFPMPSAGRKIAQSPEAEFAPTTSIPFVPNDEDATPEGELALLFASKNLHAALVRAHEFRNAKVLSTQKLTSLVYSYLLKYRGQDRDVIVHELSSFKQPITLWETALTEFGKFGSEERLTAAADIVSRMQISLETFRGLIDRDANRAFYLIPAIRYSEILMKDEKLSLLQHITDIGDDETKSAAVEAIEELE